MSNVRRQVNTFKLLLGLTLAIAIQVQAASPSDEIDVQAVVVERQVKNLLAWYRSSSTPICLSVSPEEKDLPAPVARAVQNVFPTVLRSPNCRQPCQQFPPSREMRFVCAFVSVGMVKLVGPNEAQVESGVATGLLAGHSELYVLRKIDGRWQIFGVQARSVS